MEEFNEAMFKTKVDNVFVKLLTAVMEGDLSSVKHFISDEVYQKYQDIIDKLDGRNERQMYDELNVKNTYVESREIVDDKEIVQVRIISRYMDYLIDKDTGNLIRGDNTRRIERDYHLTFTKKLITKDIGLVRKCPGCGASISVNTSGKCEYCDTIYNLEDYDYVLVDINII